MSTRWTGRKMYTKEKDPEKKSRPVLSCLHRSRELELFRLSRTVRGLVYCFWISPLSVDIFVILKVGQRVCDKTEISVLSGNGRHLLYSLRSSATCEHMCAPCLHTHAHARTHTHAYTHTHTYTCLLYTSPSPRDLDRSRMPSSA